MKQLVLAGLGSVVLASAVMAGPARAASPATDFVGATIVPVQSPYYYDDDRNRGGYRYREYDHRYHDPRDRDRYWGERERYEQRRHERRRYRDDDED